MLRSLTPVAIAIAVLALVQLLLNKFEMEFVSVLAMKVGISVILAVSLNIINGMTGQFSIGHAGFMAVGAYTASSLTLMLADYRLSFLPPVLSDQVYFVLALIVGGAAAALAGFLVGLPSLRLRGDYLAIVTLGFGEIIRVIVQNSPSLGGSLGLNNVPGYTTVAMVWFWAFVVVLLAFRLSQSPHGRALWAIREDEVAAEAMGVDTTGYKVRAFVVSSFFAGVAGGLFTHYLRIATPAKFDFMLSMEVVVMVVAGGLGSTSGAVSAAIFLTLLPEGLRTLFRSVGPEDGSWADKVDQVRMPIYGLLLVVIMLTRPQGIFGRHEVWDRWLKPKKKPVSA